MDRKEKIFIAAAAFFITLVAITVLTPPDSREGLDGDRVNATFDIREKPWVLLQVADNETERREGLMNVTELGKHEGMIFIYKKEAPRGFWMKNTLIPLDMIFLDADRQVINVETAYPEPNTSEENLTLYRSERPAKYVIEVNAGFAENYSVEEGDAVEWNQP